MFAQKTITEGLFKDKDGEMPISYSIIDRSNELIVNKGNNYTLTYATKITNSKIYNTKGESRPFETFDGLTYLKLSDIDDSYKIGTFKGSTTFKSQNNYLIYQNLKTEIKSQEENFGLNMFFDKSGLTYFSDDKLEYDFVKEGYLKFKKRDYFIHRYDIAAKKFFNFQVQEPNLLEVNRKEFRDFEEDHFKFKMINKRNFDIVQKTISKEGNSSTLYRFIYDLDGKIIKEAKYNISLENPFTISNNNGGVMKQRNYMTGNGGMNSFFVVSEVNFSYDYEVDKKGNTYVYGILGTKGKKSVDSNPKGYFVIKYDTDGKKIWERITYMDDPKNEKLNRKFSGLESRYLKINLDVKEDNVTFLLNVESEEFHFYDVIDNKNGNSKKANYIVFDLDRILAISAKNSLVYAFYEIEKIETLKKKRFDLSTMINYDNVLNVKKYIDNVAADKNKVYFNSINSDDGIGIWLVESDNETYYKFTYFEN